MALVDIRLRSRTTYSRMKRSKNLFTKTSHYRDKQLLRLKDEVLDMEDLGDSVSLTEFTLDDFRLELTKYIEANRTSSRSSSFGLYAVVPPHPDSKLCAWCRLLPPQETRANDSRARLRIAKVGSAESINPLQPYFLVYVWTTEMSDLDLRIPSRFWKSIASSVRAKATLQDLCNVFDQQTNHGSDMKAYNLLLERP